MRRNGAWAYVNDVEADNIYPCQPIGCDAGIHINGCYFLQYETESEETMTARAKMTQVPTTEDDFEANADVSYSPEGWEWETVEEGAPTKILFDTIGDSFVGQYIDDEHVDREPTANGEDMSFVLFIFRGRDGDRYAINKSFALEEAMKKVDRGAWCRITYIKDIPTARKQNDMKDFRVDVRK